MDAKENSIKRLLSKPHLTGHGAAKTQVYMATGVPDFSRRIPQGVPTMPVTVSLAPTLISALTPQESSIFGPTLIKGALTRRSCSPCALILHPDFEQWSHPNLHLTLAPIGGPRDPVPLP